MHSNNIDKKLSHSITLKEVHDLAMDFFERNTSEESVDRIEKLFLHPDARIHVPDGQAFSLEEHRLLHTRWKDGSLCFNLYVSSFFHPLPDSAPIDI